MIDLKLTPLNKRLVFPDGHVEEGYEVTFMTERKYLPTIADLIDRLSISLMKSIFIDRDAYRDEMKLIREDIDNAPPAVLQAKSSDLVYAILVLMLANRYIWENEGKVRENDGRQDDVTWDNMTLDRLRATHSINGVRTRAKNEISKIFGERTDGKIDCLAADLPPEFGNWRVFDD